MAKIRNTGVNVRGIATCVSKELNNVYDSIADFQDRDIERVVKMSGVKQRHINPPDLCASDLCAHAANELLSNLKWEPHSIDLLVFVGHASDYICPATACELQERLGLSTDCAAFDVAQGCSGYPYGLSIASSMMQNSNMNRALVLIGETPTKLSHPSDRSTSLIFGDAGSATVLESDGSSEEITFVLGTDGSGKDDFIVPAGGCRNRFAKDEKDYYIKMNGAGIFEFTMKRVPSLIEDSLNLAGLDREFIDYFIFHQANLHIMEYLRKRAKIPQNKVPVIIDRFGNTGGASIPLAITQGNLDIEDKKKLKMLLLGFGVGLSWGSACFNLDPSVMLLHSTI